MKTCFSFRRALLAWGALTSAWMVGCGSGDTWTLEGECDPPAGATTVGVGATLLGQPSCLIDGAEELRLASSQAEWDALFECPTPVPEGVDLATSRLAVIRGMCAPLSFRFAVETAAEVVVGVHTGVSGACASDVLVVPLPASTKSVRVARCRDECHGTCPPVP